MPNFSSSLDIDRIFPIPDAPSARLMKLKARCLRRAGVLSEEERQAVDRHADEVLSEPSASSFPRPSYNSQAA